MGKNNAKRLPNVEINLFAGLPARPISSSLQATACDGRRYMPHISFSCTLNQFGVIMTLHRGQHTHTHTCASTVHANGRYNTVRRLYAVILIRIKIRLMLIDSLAGAALSLIDYMTADQFGDHQINEMRLNAGPLIYFALRTPNRYMRCSLIPRAALVVHRYEIGVQGGESERGSEWRAHVRLTVSGTPQHITISKSSGTLASEASQLFYGNCTCEPCAKHVHSFDQ